MSGPLADVRVIAVEQYGAGPWATLQLADLGADVIKVEDPGSGGDVGRYVPPYQEGEDSLFFESFNRGKRSIALDLRTETGRGVLRDLVAASDAVFSNLRGDLPARLGLRYQDLEEANPRIVCCSLSGFGMTGPRAAQPGYDYLIQGLAGWMSLTGAPDAPPMKSGLSLVDLSAGYVAAIAILAGVTQARSTGIGCDCDISLFETALHELAYLGTWAATAGYEPQRLENSAHPSVVPFQNFRTLDGWIVVACPKEKFWERLRDALADDTLVADERFGTFAARLEHRETLIPLLEAHFVTRPTAEWLEILAEAGVPSAPVNDVRAALADPQAEARGAVVESEHPRFGTVRQIASPLRVGAGGRPQRRGPARGEHQAEVLREVCGYDAATIAELRRAGAFGPAAAVDGE